MWDRIFMRDIRWENSRLEKIADNGRRRIIISFFLIGLIFISALAMVSIFKGNPGGYTSVTKVCISCHNDSDYPNDTNFDGVRAPYKRPHNDTVMCESCHRTNPHTLTYIQKDGNYGMNISAASCPECHSTGIPSQNNSNFSSAPMIPVVLRHSSSTLNGSIWGNYWTNTSPKTACIYCHNNTLHNTTPFGRILQLFPDYQRNGSIGVNLTCAGCHYKGAPKWSQMNLTFTSAGLPTPPEITNGTNWNGISHKYINHSIDSFDDLACKSCHGTSLNANATMIEFIHNVEEGAGGEECMTCHASRMGDYPAINVSLFGKHRNTNNSGGNNTLTNGDCITCHYDFNYSEMAAPGFTTRTYNCTDCHINGNFSAPVITSHRTPNETPVPGARITTGTYCSTCHNNSLNTFIYSVNASVAHYGTNTSLAKPTVNRTAKPVFGFMNETDASAYNTPCNYCHNPPNLSYGTPTRINTTGHTTLGTCDQCHVSGSADNLHNSSLGMPVTFRCIDCHRTYADRYQAPNLTGTQHLLNSCDESNCHMMDAGTPGQFDVLADHNASWLFNPNYPPTTDTVYLNNATSISVTKGSIVNITSRINDFAREASRVRGAEYFLNTSLDPGLGKGTPMNAADGYYDAANGAWENVTGSLYTGSLSAGTYTVYVRGMDIGKQWSPVQSAILTVVSLGYINGTVTNGTSGIAGATISATNASTTSAVDGTFNISISSGTYNVTASKQPEYYDNVTSGVTVTPGNTTILYIVITGKPTGTLSGVVRSI